MVKVLTLGLIGFITNERVFFWHHRIPNQMHSGSYHTFFQFLLPALWLWALSTPRDHSLRWQSVQLSETRNCHARFHWTNRQRSDEAAASVIAGLWPALTLRQSCFSPASQGHPFTFNKLNGGIKIYICPRLHIWMCVHVNSSPGLSHSWIYPCLFCTP